MRKCMSFPWITNAQGATKRYEYQSQKNNGLLQVEKYEVDAFSVHGVKVTSVSETQLMLLRHLKRRVQLTGKKTSLEGRVEGLGWPRCVWVD